MSTEAVYRKASAAPRRARVVAYDRLPSAVRERLARGLANGAPDALLAAPSGYAPRAQRALVALGVSTMLAVLALAHRHIGSVAESDVLQPGWFAGIYAALFALLGVVIVAFVGLKRFQRGAPFASGHYLFALDLVEVAGGELRLTSLDTLRALEPRGRQIAVVFQDGHAVLFPVPKKEDPRVLADAHHRSIKAALDLTYPADETRLGLLDPFFEVRVSEDWDASAPSTARPSEEGAPAKAAARRVSLRARIALASIAALAVSVPLGFGFLRARNDMSDDMMFDAACGTPAADWYVRAMLDYAAHGQRHHDEALHLIVEHSRAAPGRLAKLVSQGGVLGELAEDALFELSKTEPDDLTRFIRRGGRHAADADEALFAIAKELDSVASYGTYIAAGKLHVAEAKALLPEADFRQASRSAQVGSLCSFVRRNPGSKHEDEAWKGIRAAYAAALPAFQAHEAPPAAGLEFAKVLLEVLLERADPRVTLDVITTEPTAVAVADLALGAKYGPNYLAAASHFRALDGLREEVRGSVMGWLAKAFPGGVVEGSRPSSDEPEDARPRIVVRLEPVVDGSSSWGNTDVATNSDPKALHVTPLVAFKVEVTGTVRRADAATVTTVNWTTRLADVSDGKMMTKFRGRARTPAEMLEDVYAPFFGTVPSRIAESFHNRF